MSKAKSKKPISKKSTTQKSNDTHWTSANADSFKYFVASDFVDQLSAHLKEKGIDQREFANRLGVTEGRISQVFNEPGNLTLNTLVSWTQAADLKTSIVVYNDEDSKKQHSPLSGSIFNECWRQMDSPLEMPKSQSAIPARGFDQILFDGVRCDAFVTVFRSGALDYSNTNYDGSHQMKIGSTASTTKDFKMSAESSENSYADRENVIPFKRTGT